jgi:hypothetical protein
LAAAGFERTIWSISAEKFVSSDSRGNETLPIGACTFPPLSTRNSIFPAFVSRTARARSKVTVPAFGFGISPRGPRTRPSWPTCPIWSGVAIITSKSSQPSLMRWTYSTPT